PHGRATGDGTGSAGIGVADPGRPGRARRDHHRPHLPPGPRLREHRGETVGPGLADPARGLTQFTDTTVRSMLSSPSLRCWMRAGTGMSLTSDTTVCLSPSSWTSPVASRDCPPLLTCS